MATNKKKTTKKRMSEVVTATEMTVVEAKFQPEVEQALEKLKEVF